MDGLGKLAVGACATTNTEEYDNHARTFDIFTVGVGVIRPVVKKFVEPDGVGVVFAVKLGGILHVMADDVMTFERDAPPAVTSTSGLSFIRTSTS